MIGYTLAIVLKNKQADGKMVGVKIGRICINKNISVKEIAEIAGVSNVNVYAWFAGEYAPQPNTAKKIFDYLARQ